jgi:DNA repair protein RadC
LDEGEVLQLMLARVRPSAAASLAAALLARFGGIGRVLGAPTVDLARVVGCEVAEELDLLHALWVRSLAFPLHDRDVLSSWEAAKTYLCARLRPLPREVIQVLFLDKKNQLIADERLGEGTVDHAPVYPREVVRRALELSASALVLAHNHPSGDPAPSRADIEMTQQVVAAAKALQIAVHDHLIIGAQQVVSLRAQGLM